MIRFARALILLLAVNLTGLIILDVRVHARPGPRSAARRYVSAQAYNHALRAELALTRHDWETAHDELQLALVYDPSSVYLHAKLIRLALTQGHLTRARKYARRARLLATDRVEILRLVADVARAEGRLNDAEHVLRLALRKSPDDLDTGLALADVVAARSRNEPALQILNRLSARHPHSASPLVASAHLLRAAGRWADAAAVLARARDRQALGKGATSELADNLERTRQLARAEEVWLEFVMRHPTDSDARRSAARLALARGDIEAADRYLADARHDEAALGFVFLSEGYDRRALKHLSAAVANARSADEARASLRLGLGRARARLGRHAEAVATLSGVRSDSDAYVQARLLMTRALIRQGRSVQALRAVRVAVDERPNSTRLLEQYAATSGRQGRVEAALQRVRAARTARPLETRLLSLELRLLDRLERSAEADALMDAAFRAVDEASWHRLATERARRRGHDEDARASVLRWLELSPRDVDALLAAIELEGLAAADRRASWAERALAERPRDPRTLGAYGFARLRDGDHSTALDYLRRSVRLDPWDARAAERLGDAAMSAGLDDEARRAYRVARRAVAASRSGRSKVEAERRLRRKSGATRRTK